VLTYIIRRLIYMIPVLIFISIFIFTLVRLVPGDPASAILGDQATPERVERLRQSLRLDRPVYEQYGVFMKNLVQGDLGDSIRRREPCATLSSSEFSRHFFSRFTPW
jgi:peptide/nickel transport system permease protein